jgi:peptidoglycan/xylan/chitin deacetylase (PgdA/CDA1 family)
MISILMYHRVAVIPSALDPLGLAVSPDQFDKQMGYLARNGYQCLTMAQAVRYYQEGMPAQPKSFVLTFDDGYQDLYSRVCPILEKYGFTATVFLVVGYMGSTSNWAGQKGVCSSAMLSWAEARELAFRGFTLGSHTISHPLLYNLDEQSAFEEIRNSRVLLQNRLDMQIDFFSYPYSYADTRTEMLVETVGYQAACAGDSGSWGIFHLWRVPCLRDDTPFSFTLKANGTYARWTALRESLPGSFLRHSIRRLRGKPAIRYPQPPETFDPEPCKNLERES